MDLLVRLLGAYLLGSVNGALLVGRLAGGVDIRTQGSGNAGGTNALRTQGPAFAFAVLLIDILKGWLAAAWLGTLPLPAPVTSAGAALGLAWSPVVCALAAIVGHVWPLFHGFRGGKGVATLLGAVAGLVPGQLLGVLGVWLVMMGLFGFVGLASIVATAALPVLLLLRPPPGVDLTPLLVFGVACALLVAWTHRGNLQRMGAGSEPRSRRLWLLGKLRSRTRA
ncbi:MAG: glycerol-3-phosphate 1-O-acyltransferase PlsY [Sinobacteraceae bacterium]|nr:glycerol-3-phosphate 1-O-acyltransferase PlsY [Nevskiaceae bacterium]